MLDPLPESWIEHIRGWAERTPSVEAVYVFGSRARGSAREDSDLDLALTIAGPDEGERLANSIFCAEKWSTELQHGLPVDLDLDVIGSDDVVVGPAVNEHGRLLWSATK